MNLIFENINARPPHADSRRSADMDAREEELKCPVCVEPFTDPVPFHVGTTSVKPASKWSGTWMTPTSREGPLFCPECQILLPPDLSLRSTQIFKGKFRMPLQSTSLEESSQMSRSIIMCDQCIGKTEVAVKSCLTCDASLCSAHTLLHQQREALRGHSIIEVTEDLFSFKCKEHGEELKLFCQEDQIAVCCVHCSWFTQKPSSCYAARDMLRVQEDRFNN